MMSSYVSHYRMRGTVAVMLSSILDNLTPSSAWNTKCEAMNAGSSLSGGYAEGDMAATKMTTVRDSR